MLFTLSISHEHMTTIIGDQAHLNIICYMFLATMFEIDGLVQERSNSVVLLKHWSYVFLVLTHRNVYQNIYVESQWYHMRANGSETSCISIVCFMYLFRLITKHQSPTLLAFCVWNSPVTIGIHLQRICCAESVSVCDIIMRSWLSRFGFTEEFHGKSRFHTMIVVNNWDRRRHGDIDLGHNGWSNGTKPLPKPCWHISKMFCGML